MTLQEMAWEERLVACFVGLLWLVYVGMAVVAVGSIGWVLREGIRELFQ